MIVSFFGVPVDALTGEEVKNRIRGFLLAKNGRGRAVFTPNPEILVAAWRDPSFCDTLKTGDINIPDGVGIVWLAKILGRRISERVTGTDLMNEVCGLAAELGASVFFLGGGPGTAAEAARVMSAGHRGLMVVGADDGGVVEMDSQGRPILSDELRRKIEAASPAVVFVAFGHGKQEKWIQAHLSSLPSVRVAMGIGGAFDFWSGNVRRAPAFMRSVGLEWLWRLVLQPRRIGRILTATFVFPALVVGQRFGIIKVK
ncbi:MAG: WecB/TagA/CpsF family glycosyltransferase [bacterium]